MSRSKHKQNAVQWNPPKLKEETVLPFDDPQYVVSATECTGLTQQPLMNQSECVDMADLYATIDLKPQGNVGKDNPNNDPSEIHFHRTAQQP